MFLISIHNRASLIGPTRKREDMLYAIFLPIAHAVLVALVLLMCKRGERVLAYLTSVMTASYMVALGLVLWSLSQQPPTFNLITAWIVTLAHLGVAILLYCAAARWQRISRQVDAHLQIVNQERVITPAPSHRSGNRPMQARRHGTPRSQERNVSL